MVNIRVYIYDRSLYFEDIEYIIEDNVLLIFRPNKFTGKIVAQFARWVGVVEDDA